MTSRRDETIGPIVAWGDSHTAGRSAGKGNSYPDALGRLFDPPRQILNRGTGGETSEQIRTRFLKEPDLFSGTTIIWAGANDLVARHQAIEPNIATMVAALQPNRRFLVLSVMNTDRPRQWKGGEVHRWLCRVNDGLARTYPGHFVDVRAALIARFDSSIAQDRLDCEHDVPPGSLRVDKGHLNTAGYRLVAALVYDAIMRL